MGHLREYNKSDVSIALPEVLRYLGYRDTKKTVSSAVQEIIESQTALAYAVIKPRAVHSFVDIDFFKNYALFKEARKIAIGICTIGADLQYEVDEYFKKGEFLEWLVLDAIGTVAIEYLVELVGDEIRSETSDEGLTISNRLSPGCASWDLHAQNFIFNYFSDDTAGVTINESCMMHPRKSISFAYTLYREKIGEVRADNCRHCEFYRCIYRREQGAANKEMKRSSGHKK